MLSAAVPYASPLLRDFTPQDGVESTARSNTYHRPLLHTRQQPNVLPASESKPWLLARADRYHSRPPFEQLPGAPSHPDEPFCPQQQSCDSCSFGPLCRDAPLSVSGPVGSRGAPACQEGHCHTSVAHVENPNSFANETLVFTPRVDRSDSFSRRVERDLSNSHLSSSSLEYAPLEYSIPVPSATCTTAQFPVALDDNIDTFARPVVSFPPGLCGGMEEDRGPLSYGSTPNGTAAYGDYCGHAMENRLRALKAEDAAKAAREKALQHVMLGRKKVLAWLDNGGDLEDDECSDMDDENGGPQFFCDTEKKALMEEKEQTTLMIKNVPCRFSQEELIHLLDGIGMKGTYDFFYLPMDTRGNSSRRGRPGNRGYAFVNYLSNQLAAEWRRKLEGHSFKESVSTKKLSASLAIVQGLKKNLAFYAESLLDAELKFRPELPDLCGGSEEMNQGVDVDYLLGQGVRIFLQRAAPWEVVDDVTGILDGDFIRVWPQEKTTCTEETATWEKVARLRERVPHSIERKQMVSGCLIWGLDPNPRVAKQVLKCALGTQPPPSRASVSTAPSSGAYGDSGTVIARTSTTGSLDPCCTDSDDTEVPAAVVAPEKTMTSVLVGGEEPVMGHVERKEMADFAVFTPPARFLPKSLDPRSQAFTLCCTTRPIYEVADMLVKYMFSVAAVTHDVNAICLLASLGVYLEEVTWLPSGTVLRLKDNAWCPW